MKKTYKFISALLLVFSLLMATEKVFAQGPLSCVITVNTDTLASSSMCSLSEVSLDANPSGGTGPYTFLWTTVPANTGSFDPIDAQNSNYLAPPTPTTINITIKVVVTDAVGATHTSSLLMVVKAVALLSTTPAQLDFTVCPGSPLTLIGTTGSSDTVRWLDEYGNQLGSNLGADTIWPTSYYEFDKFIAWSIHHTTGCIRTKTITVHLDSLTANSKIDTAMCAATQICLGGSPSTSQYGIGVSSYNWSSVPPIGGLVGANPCITPTVNSTVWLTVTDSKGCKAYDSTHIILNALPTPNAGPDTTVCALIPVTLRANGGGTYSWSEIPNNNTLVGQTTLQNPIVSPNITTVYTVTVTNATGCSVTDNATITVNSLPVFPPLTDVEICSGQPTTLTSGGGTTYSWSSNPSGGYPATVSITVSPTITTTYTVIITNGASCSVTDDAIVTVNNPPTVTLGADQQICKGETATITATVTGGGNIVYSWSSIPGGTFTPTATITVSPIVNTTYTITVTNPCGSATDQVIVTVDALPPVFAGNDTSICRGNPANLHGTGGGLYSWSESPALGTLGAQTANQNPVVTPLTNTTYTLTVTAVNGCTASDAVVVFVDTLPLVPVITALPNPVCEGSTTIICVTTNNPGPFSVVWSSNPAGFASVLLCNTVTPLVTTTYTATITTACGTESSDIVVTVHAKPPVNAGADVHICRGNNTQLLATGASSYVWLPNNMTLSSLVIANPIASPTVTTTYTVTGTDAFGCTNTDDVIVFVDTAFASAGADQNICLGDTANLAAVASPNPISGWAWSSTSGGVYPAAAAIAVTPIVNTTYTVSVTTGCGTASDQVIVNVTLLPVAIPGGTDTICSGDVKTLTGSGGTTGYLWASNPFDISLAGHENEQNPTVSPIITTTYTLTVTANCGTDSASVVINVNYLPTADAGAAQTLCINECANIAATVTGGGPYTYSWSSVPVGFNSNAIGFNVCPLVTTTYTITVTSACGSATDDVIITVHPLPIVSVGPDRTICINICTDIVATGAATYLWNDGSSNDTLNVCPLVQTTYTVTGTDINGCSNTDQIIISVDPPNADAGADTTICFGSTAHLHASGGSLFSWSTTQPGTLNSTSIANPIASPTVTATYIVLITSVNGCTDLDTMVVNVVKPRVDAGADQIICSGNSVTLNTSVVGGMPYTYLWNPNTDLVTSTSANPIASPTITTTYIVSFSSLCGNDEDTVVVFVSNVPVVTISPASTICNGSCLDIVATGGGTYLWTTGSINDTIHVCPAITTTYTVTVTSPCGIATADVVITVDSIPTVIASIDNDTICNGTPINLSAAITGGGIITYSWSANGAAPFSASATPTANPIVNTTYTVTATNHCGVATDAVTVIVYTTTANAGLDTIICDGASATINATGGGSYNWNNGLGTNAAVIVTPNASITYIVTVTNNGCTDTDDIAITVNPSPTAQILSSASATGCGLCNGTGTGLAAGGTTPYQFVGWPNTTIEIGPNAIALCGGVNNFVVVDMNQCTANASVFLTDQGAIPIVLSSDINSPICANELVTFTTTAGFDTVKFYINGLLVQNSIINTYATVITNGQTVSASGILGNCASASNAITFVVNPAPTADAGLDTTLCAGQSHTFNATGGPAYAWTSSSGGAIAPIANPTVTPVFTTTYYLAVTTACGVARDTAIIHVNAIPVVTISPDIAICLGSSTTLTATGGPTYDWSYNSLTTPSIVVTPLVNTTYAVTVTQGGCSASQDVAVSLDSIIKYDVTGGGSLCIYEAGDIINLNNSTVGVSYQLVPIGTSQNGTGAALTWNNNNLAGTYFVIGTNVLGCSDTMNGSATVTVFPVTPADAGNDTAICSGMSATLHANGGVSFVWDNSTFNRVRIVSPVVTTTYRVTVTAANGCTAMDSVVVTVNSLNVVVTNDTVICKGSSVQLNATGGANYLWSPGGTLVWPNIANPVATPIINTTYVVTVTAITGCSGTADVVVGLNVINKYNVTGGGAFCAGGIGVPVGLSGSQVNVVYTLQSIGTNVNGNGSSISFGNVVDPGIYTVTALNTVTGCTETMNGSVVVTENQLPSPDAGQDQTICRNACATLTATGGPTYQWSAGGLTASITVCPLVDVTYTLTVTNASNCTASDDVIVHVSFPPVNAGVDVVKCSDDSIQLAGSGGSTYLWSPNYNISDINAFNPLVWPTVTTTYVLTTAGMDGCTASDAVVVSVSNFNVAIIPPDAIICLGSSVTLSASAAGNIGYIWSTGDTVASITVSPTITTTYCVTVTRDCGTLSNCAVVTVSPDPAAVVDPTHATLCVGSNILLQAFGGDTFLWSPAAGLSNVNINNPIANPVVNTTYFVTVTSSCGSAVNSIIVDVNTIPTANAGPDLNLCLNHIVPLSVSVTGGGIPSYTWTTVPPLASLVGQEHLPNPIITLSTSVTVIVEVDNGCGIAIDTVHLNANDVVALISPPAPIICANGSVTLTPSGGDTYIWDIGPSTATITVSPTVTTTYTVTATLSSCGCTDDATVVVTVAPSPTATIVSEIDPTSCGANNGSAQVAGSGGTFPYTFIWPDGQTGFTAINLAAGVWIPTVTDLNGCTGITQATLTDSGATPVMLFANPGITICENAFVTITANPPGFASYDFSRNGASVQISASNTYASNTFVDGEMVSVVAHDATGCVSSDVIGPFVIGSLPVAFAGNDQTVCSGIPVNLCASAINVTGYSWSNGGNTQCVSVLPLVTIVYGVTVSNACGTAQDNVTVNVTQTPTVTANDAIICNESSIALDADTTNSTSLIWTAFPSPPPLSPTSINPVVSPNVQTTYTLTAYNGGCSATADAVVSVNSVQLCTVSGGGPFCEDTDSATIVLNCSEVGVFYQLKFGSLLSISMLPPVPGTGGPLTFTVSTAGIYGVIGTSMITSCSDTMLSSVLVTMDAKPTVFAGRDTILCFANSFQITTANPQNYFPGTINWTSPEGGTFVPQDGVNPVYTPVVNSGTVHLVLSVQGVNSCSSYPFSDTMLLVVNPLPPITAGADTSICSDDYAQLHVWGGAAGSQYLWSNPATLTNAAIYNPVADPSASTTYTVRVTTAQGCTASDNVVVYVKQVPTPTITVVGDTVACNGLPVNVTFWTNLGFVNYQWIKNAVDIPNANLVSYNALQAGTYTVHVIAPNGCDAASASVTTYERPLYSPIIHSGGPSTFCDGDHTYLIPDFTYYTYLWTSGSTTDSILVMEQGAYNVTVTDFFGCKGVSNTIDVFVDPLPAASFSYADSLLSVDFFDLSLNGTSWLWKFGDGSTSTDENPTHFYERAGTYIVKLVVSNDCGTDSLAIQITVVKNTGIGSNGRLTRMVVYPNPSTGIFNLNLDLSITSNLEMKISDAIGNEVWTNKIANASGHVVESIDLTGYSKGIYLLKLKVDKTVYVRKIILD